MDRFSEEDIREIVSRVVAQTGSAAGAAEGGACFGGMEIPVEISARHVHLTQEAVEILFGRGHRLTRKRDLSQPGQFLSEERVKLATVQGEIANVGILGPVRDAIQVELSLTDARTLGVRAPICLSGDLAGAADVVIIGPKGVVTARGSAIVAKAHVHMSPADAACYGVQDGERVGIRLGEERPVTLEDVIVRVGKEHVLAVHIDFDEANAARVSGSGIVGRLQKRALRPGGFVQCAAQQSPASRESAVFQGGTVSAGERLVTEAVALQLVREGCTVSLPAGTIVTPSARDVFTQARVTLVQEH